MSLNEQLAEAVMGMHKIKHLWYSCPNPKSYTDAEYSTVDTVSDQLEVWNPTQDLNQLRECYLAAEKDCKKSVPKDAFASDFIDALVEVWIDIADHVPTDREIATAWVTRPKFVAQAILKAKGVS